MKSHDTPAVPPSYRLPILPPPCAWPWLLTEAAAILEGRSDANPEAIATDLRLIAGALPVTLAGVAR